MFPKTLFGKGYHRMASHQELEQGSRQDLTDFSNSFFLPKTSCCSKLSELQKVFTYPTHGKSNIKRIL